MPLLATDSFCVMRDRVEVVHEVALAVDAGEVVALCGQNGAGKTTLLEGLGGLLETTGAVEVGGQRVTAQGPNARLRYGICLCPDGRHLFPDMSISDNLKLGAFRASAPERHEREQDLLESVPFLKARSGQRARTLSGGEQQLVAVCRSLMTNPVVLLLDSPTSGLAPAFRLQIGSLVKRFLSGGRRAVIVADDNADFLSALQARPITLARGRVVHSEDS